MRITFDLALAYGQGLWVGLPRLLVLLTLALAGSWLLLSRWGDRLRRLNGRWLEWGVFATALVGGMALVVSEASIFDDAYISFRYVRNFLDGHGLVFNLGERVEGYTNFAWVMLVALGHALTAIEIPLIAIIFSMTCWVGNIVVIFALSKRLRATLSRGYTIPFAAVLVAVQSTYVEFGTTGLETGFCSLMVNLGLYQLIIRTRARHALAAGGLLIMATLGRPDHGLMYAAGGLSLLLLHGRALWAAKKGPLMAFRRAGLDHLIAFALPFIAYLAYLAWKLSYYGEILPNTYYAKSADLWWPTQGGLYATIFLLQSSMVWLGPLFIIWLLWPARDETSRRFKAFAGPAVIIFSLYVIKIGGDFMHGRFFVTLIPLVLLAMEHLLLRVYTEARRSGALPVWRQRLFIVAPLVLCSAGGIDLFRPREVIGGITRENTYYPLAEWSPVVIDHPNYRTGKILGKLKDAGVEPLIGDGNIGMLGYYSGLRFVDLVGLVDYQIARQPLKHRKRPGHEKSASRAYLEQRDPILLGNRRAYIDVEHSRVSTVKIGSSYRLWSLRGYPVELIDKIRRVAPEIEIPDIVSWIDELIRHQTRHPPTTQKELDRAEKDIEFIRGYYLRRNADVEREAQIDAISKAASQARVVLERGRDEESQPMSLLGTTRRSSSSADS